MRRLARPSGLLAAGRVCALLVCFSVGLSFAIELPTKEGIVAGEEGFAIGGGIDQIRTRRVSFIGDFNGDGLADLGVAAHEGNQDAEIQIDIYVVFGKADGAYVQLGDIRGGGSAGTWIEGLTQSGQSLVTTPGFIRPAGDVNGDGYSDLVAGYSLLSAPGGIEQGRSLVVFGRAPSESFSLADVLAGEGGFVINGALDLQRSGEEVRGAGDVNGDGFDDLILAVWPAYDTPQDLAPTEARVIFGKSDGAPVELSDVDAGEGGFLISLPQGAVHTSPAVAVVGDVNGDGLDDLGIATSQVTPSGPQPDIDMAAVVFGREGTEVLDISAHAPGPWGFWIEPSPRDLAFGSLAGVGDLNGDGLGEVLLSSPGYAEVPGVGGGGAHLIYGRSAIDPILTAQIELGNGGYTLVGNLHWGNTGREIAGAGDMTGEGMPELLLFALGEYVGTTPNFFGNLYAALGRTGGSKVRLGDVHAGIGGFGLRGADSEEFLGPSPTGAADVDGDGLSDIAFTGAGPYFAQFQTAFGEAYVLRSPYDPAPEGNYAVRSRVGDGPGGDIVTERKFDVAARVTINFSDDDFGHGNGPSGSSLDIVRICRTKNLIAGLGPIEEVANVMWRVTTDRTDFESARLKFRYTDADIQGIAGPESDLVVFKADDPAGPWLPLATEIDAARNLAIVEVGSLSYFAIANGHLAGPVNRTRHWLPYD